MTAGVFERLRDAVKALLLTEPAFVSALTTSITAGGIGLPRAPTAVLAAQPLAQVANLHADQLPVFLLEPDTARAAAIPGLSNDPSGMTIGGGQQAMQVDYSGTLVWAEDDRETAALQRRRLMDQFPKLWLRNPDAGCLDVASVVVSGMAPDLGVRHPTQVFNFILTADVAVQRTE